MLGPGEKVLDAIVRLRGALQNLGPGDAKVAVEIDGASGERLMRELNREEVFRYVSSRRPSIRQEAANRWRLEVAGVTVSWSEFSGLVDPLEQLMNAGLETAAPKLETDPSGPAHFQS